MIKKYICPWCGNEFEREVNYVEGGHKGSYSTPVRCSMCGNLIPTWKREKTDRINKKHIHIRK